MRTFIEVLRDNAVYSEHAHTFVLLDNSERVIRYPEMWRLACQRAHRLHELGLRKGDRVAIILPEPDAFVLAFIGALTGGIIPVPMYPPLTLSKMEAYGDTVEHILKASGAKALITVPGLEAMLSQRLAKACGPDARVILDHELEGPVQERPSPPCEVTPEDTAFLQFTSGSTRKPKGVVVSHHNLSVNAHSIMFDGLRSTSKDKGVSWLPLYHDMGLIGFVIAPLFAQVQVMFLPTLSFIRRPAMWLDAINRFRGTITFAPNFAYALATRAISERKSKDWDLSCLKALGCGAEPVMPDVVRGFLKRFEPEGLKPEAMLPCYGLAEATLAVTFSRLDAPMATDRVDVVAMEAGTAKPTEASDGLELVSCGRPFPGHELAIVNDAGQRLPERSVGHVTLRGPSVANGYFQSPGDTKECFKDGWLHTGDLGYMANGELFLCGRAKDLIIINGKNYYPQDVERIAADTYGVRPDQAIAFARKSNIGSEECVVVIESSRGILDLAAAKSQIKQRVRSDLGIPVAEVVMIRRNTMPKTSSGKVRRRETKARLAQGTLELHVPKTRRPRPPSAGAPLPRQSSPAAL